MEKDARYFTTGVFVCASLLGLVVFFIWLAGMHATGDYDRYTVYFTDPVSGLDKDAMVKYKGVEVGKILEMRLSDERNDLIKVDIEVKDDTPIRAQTTAKIEIQGITGQNYIELTTDNSDKNPPREIPDERYPVLKGTGNQLSKFFEDMPKMSKQLLETLAALNVLAQSGSKTAESVRELTEKLKENPSQVLFPSSRKGVEIPK